MRELHRIRLRELRVRTTALLVPNIVIMFNTILPIKLYSAQPSDDAEVKAARAAVVEGKAGMVTDGSTVESAATVPAAYEWLFKGVPLPDVSKDETREKLLEMIVKKVNAALPTLAAQQAGA